MVKNLLYRVEKSINLNLTEISIRFNIHQERSADKPHVGSRASEKYVYLSILAYWISGVLISSFVIANSSGIAIQADILLGLLASYLIGISLAVFQSYCRNIGLSLLFSILVPCVPLVIGLSWMFPLLAIGFTVVAWRRRSNIGESIGRAGLADVATLIVASCAFAVLTLISVHDADFFLLWDISRNSAANDDPLFHSAITAMIKNYGVLSTGLDGLVVQNYHAFSHVLRAAISFGTGLPVLTSYGAMQLLVSEPLLFMTIVAAAETIRPSVKAGVFLIRIVVLFIAFYSIHTLPEFDKFALWESYSTSDSYAISLTLLLGAICATRMEMGGYRLGALVVLTLLTTASKVSTGAICVAIMTTYLALFDPELRVRRFIAWIGLMAVWAVVVYYETSHAWIAIGLPWLFRKLEVSAILEFGVLTAVVASVAAAIFLFVKYRKVLHKHARIKPLSNFVGFDPAKILKRILITVALAAGVAMMAAVFWFLMHLKELLNVALSKLHNYFGAFDNNIALKGGKFVTVVAGIWGIYLLLKHRKALIKWATIKFNALILSGTHLLLVHQKILRKYVMIACVFYAIVSFALHLKANPPNFWINPPLVNSGEFLQDYVGSNFPKDSRNPEFWPAIGGFALVHFFFTWLLAILAANLYIFDKSKARYLGAPILFSMVSLGIVLPILFYVEMGSAMYFFTSIPLFLALPYLLITLSERISGRGFAESVVANAVPFFVLIGSIAGTVVLMHEKGWGNFIIEAEEKTRNPNKLTHQMKPSDQMKLSYQESPSDQTTHLKLMAYLNEIREDASTKNLGVYIAREEKAFWDTDPAYLCRNRPFYIPAVAERPGLFALPDPVRCKVSGYGYVSYRHDEFEMSARARVSHEELLKKAAESGLDGYVDVRASGWAVYRNNAVAGTPKRSVVQ